MNKLTVHVLGSLCCPDDGSPVYLKQEYLECSSCKKNSRDLEVYTMDPTPKMIDKILPRKKILCLVPLPPPIMGDAVASEVLITFLRKRHEVKVLPFQRGNLVSGKFSLKQLARILIIGMKLGFMYKNFDIAYHVVSSTFLGNMRDMLLLFMMGGKLRKKAVLHRHGANLDEYLESAPLWIKFLNKKMLGDVRKAVVLGETFNRTFKGYIPDDRINIVNNFFTPSLLIAKERLHAKFDAVKRVNILFLSNLIKEKGYELLLDAFLSLSEDIRSRAELHFAGQFYSEADRTFFLHRIKGKEEIFYHGPVSGKDKQKLLWDAHVFCLPTYYKYEGQPISIIEAYAAGCIVVSTPAGGITDIFTDGTNGLQINVDMKTLILRPDADTTRLKEKLTEVLGMLLLYIDEYKSIAYFNRSEAAGKYTEEAFCNNMEQALT